MNPDDFEDKSQSLYERLDYSKEDYVIAIMTLLRDNNHVKENMRIVKGTRLTLEPPFHVRTVFSQFDENNEVEEIYAIVGKVDRIFRETLIKDPLLQKKWDEL